MLFALLACDKAGVTTDNASPTTPTSASLTPAAQQTPPQNPEDLMPRVRASEAIQLVKDGKAVILDVRGTEAYKAAHIKGSIDYPLNKLESGDFAGLPSNKRIISYCT